MQIYTFSVKKPRKITLFLDFLRFIFTLFLLLPFSLLTFSKAQANCSLENRHLHALYLQKLQSAMTTFLGICLYF